MVAMENAEEVMQILDRFTRLKQKEIPKELDEYLGYVAKTGDTVFKWASLKYLFREKLLNVIKNFHDTTPRIDEIPQYPNVDPFNYESMKSSLLERLELFNAAPFTIQRLCELLIDPRKQYSRIDKFMRALEKNILVSTVEPGRKRTESENGDSLDSVVNGDLSLDVNVDIDMEADGLFNNAENTNGNGTASKAEVKAATKQDGAPKPEEKTTPTKNAHANDDENLPNPKKAKLELTGGEEETNKKKKEEENINKPNEEKEKAGEHKPAEKAKEQESVKENENEENKMECETKANTEADTKKDGLVSKSEANKEEKIKQEEKKEAEVKSQKDTEKSNDDVAIEETLTQQSEAEELNKNTEKLKEEENKDVGDANETSKTSKEENKTEKTLDESNEKPETPSETSSKNDKDEAIEKEEIDAKIKEEIKTEHLEEQKKEESSTASVVEKQELEKGEKEQKFDDETKESPVAATDKLEKESLPESDDNTKEEEAKEQESKTKENIPEKVVEKETKEHLTDQNAKDEEEKKSDKDEKDTEKTQEKISNEEHKEEGTTNKTEDEQKTKLKETNEKEIKTESDEEVKVKEQTALLENKIVTEKNDNKQTAIENETKVEPKEIAIVPATTDSAESTETEDKIKPKAAAKEDHKESTTAIITTPTLALNDQPMVEDVAIEEAEAPPIVEEVVMAEPLSSTTATVAEQIETNTTKPTAMATDDITTPSSNNTSAKGEDEPSGMDVDDTSQEEAMDQ